MAVRHQRLGGRDVTEAQFAAVWELLEGKTATAAAAASGGAGGAGRVVCISSLPFDMRAPGAVDPSLHLPAIQTPARLRPGFSQPRSTDQLHSLFTLFSYYQRAAPLLAHQNYFSHLTVLEAAADVMPGPLRERDPDAHASRRSSIQFLDNLRPKSYLSHHRLPEHDLASADESEQSIDPHFMISTTASASRSSTSAAQASATPRPRRTPTPHSLLTLAAFGSKKPGGEHADDVARPVGDANGILATSPERHIEPAPSPSAQVAPSSSALDKPLPIRPVAHVVSTSPYKEARTLIDASEKPLRRPSGASVEDDWPTLSPAQPAVPGTPRTSSHSDPVPSSPKQHSASSRMPMDATLSRTPASPGKQRPTIKMVAQSSTENILPSSGHTDKISTPPSRTSSQDTKLPVNQPTPPPKSSNLTSNSAGHTAGSSIPQPRPKLVDIPSPKSRPGRRPPVTNKGAIPRPRGNPRPGGPTQAHNTRQVSRQPESDHPRGYPRMEAPKSASPEPRSAGRAMAPPRSPVDHQENTQRKKSAIPVPSRTTSPQSIPSGPAVFTLRAKVSTPSSLGGKSLSTIESVDTGRFDQDIDTNTVMRRGPQRRPTLSGNVREYKHLSADTDADPTMLSAQTETTVSRPSSRTESLTWVETESNEGIRTKRLSSGGSSGLMSNYGPTLTISPDADELVMGRKTTPSPPVPPVSSASARSSGQRSRDLHRRAVTNEHRKASGQSDASSSMRAKSRNAAPSKTLRHQSSSDSIQAENFTVGSAAEQKHYSSDSFPRLDDGSVRKPSASQAEENFPDDHERLAAVSQTLAMLEGGHRKGAENPQLKQDAALARAYVDKDHKSPNSAHYSDVFRNSQAHGSSGGLVRSDSGHSGVSSKRVTNLSRGAANMKRSTSAISIASSRPPVPAKDYRPASKAPSKTPSIRKCDSSGRVDSSGLRSPYGLSNGYSATPSNIPQPSNGYSSSARLGSAQTMTDASQSVAGEKRSVSRAKLTMSGFRGLFHKKGDGRSAGKPSDKKKRLNTTVGSSGSPTSELGKRSGYRVAKTPSCRRSPGRSGTLTKAYHKHPAECIAALPPPEMAHESELTQTTALAMRVTRMAREQDDDSKKHQLLSVATAMLGAIDSAKHAKIAAEQAAQAAREASMHQEMTRQSLIAINKILTNSHGSGLMGTLACSRTSLRQKSSRPSTMVQ
ncbi:proteophosphoglycan 5 [Diplodia corticola]|uniref:Proteophosphoglycan 5 n=1 Tax=Diplodia corticola TaxID=236234 RepID=A0A1J9R2X2_9PEZI|nr:proteophosphoglycan 5 [Diplodia corticola]OJD35766.1 proteophosphoglycan 5 [Diplodia corticola]